MNHFSFLRNTYNSMVLTCLILVLLQVGLFAGETPSAQQSNAAIQHDLDDPPSHPQITTENKNLLNQKLQRFLKTLHSEVTLPLIKKVPRKNLQRRTNTPSRLQPM